MNKCVCDICRVNEASEKFKVKKRMKVNHELNTLGYRKIDICELCYNKLMRIPGDKKIENEIYNLIATDDWEKKYSDVDMQSAYLDGFQTVFDMLIQNKILKM